MKKKKFQISLKTWARGGNTGDITYLVDDKGMKCCLGFYLNSCKVKLDDLLNIGVPSTLKKIPEQAKWLIDGIESVRTDSNHCNVLMDLNDDRDTTDREKKKEIKKLFAEHNVEVEFIP